MNYLLKIKCEDTKKPLQLEVVFLCETVKLV